MNIGISFDVVSYNDFTMVSDIRGLGCVFHWHARVRVHLLVFSSPQGVYDWVRGLSPTHPVILHA